MARTRQRVISLGKSKPRGKGRKKAMLIRTTEEEAERIKELAIRAGMQPAVYVREAALKHKILASTDEATLRELRRLGGLLKYLHQQSNGAYTEQLADVLKALKDYIVKLASNHDHQENLCKDGSQESHGASQSRP